MTSAERHAQCVCLLRHANLHIAHTGIIEYFLHSGTVGIAHLNHYARILGEESGNEVDILELVEADTDTALRVGKAHLQQCRDKTTG